MLIIDQFPIHIAKTKNKFKENKFVKINGQLIYNQGIATFTRAIVMDNMHNAVIDALSNQKLPHITEPVQLVIRIKTVINHGNIRRKKDGTISWKKPAKDYEPTWDEDNLSSIWVKAIKDALTCMKVWKDDNVSLCRGTDSLVEFVDNLEDRQIIIYFRKI